MAAQRKLCSLIFGLLLLALEGKAASATDAELCDRAGADPDAGIPACTRLVEHPSAETKVPAVYNNRAVAKVRKGDFGGAIEDFTSAFNQNPKYVDALRNRGIVRHMQGDYDAAIVDFNRALRLDATSPDLYNARGAALFKKGEYDGAIADFDKAISLDPKYKKAFVNRGLSFHSKRQLDRAIADFDVFMALAPNEPIGYTDRATVRMDKADFKGAIADYDQAIRLDPTNSGVYTGAERRGGFKATLSGPWPITTRQSLSIPMIRKPTTIAPSPLRTKASSTKRSPIVTKPFCWTRDTTSPTQREV